MAKRKSTTKAGPRARQRGDTLPSGAAAERERHHIATLEPLEELLVTPAMMSPRLDAEPAPPEREPDPEAAAIDAAGLEQEPPEPVRPPLSGAQLIAATETGVGLLSRLDAKRLGVTWDQELEELARFNGTERVLLELVADDAAQVLGIATALPPRVAAVVFGGMVLLFWSSRHAAIKAKEPQAGKKRPATSRVEHNATWGLAADGVAPGTDVDIEGFPPPFKPS